MQGGLRMEALRSCRFCDIADGIYQYTGIDEPFLSNNEFIAVASIGALIEGWSLVIPKTHQLSMRNVYGTSAFGSFLCSVLPSLLHRYGSLVAFEHGSNKEGSLTACGTNHAHLHLVPLGKSLLPELKNSGLPWIQCHASEIASTAGGQEYLFYSDLTVKEGWHNPTGYLHVLESPLSQFFRRLVAERARKQDAFDYRLFPEFDTARETRRALSASVI